MKLIEKLDLDFIIIYIVLIYWFLNFDVYYYYEGYLLYMEILGFYIRYTELEFLGGIWILLFLIWFVSR